MRCSGPRLLSTWLRLRSTGGLAAKINARISQLAESKSATLAHAHAATGAAARRQCAAKELLR
jgi:hypothetical protein